METSLNTEKIVLKEAKKPEKKSKKEKKDIYNDTLLRKAGFLDEYAEALRPVLSVSKNPIIKNIPNFAYIPSTLYMAADVYDKYKKGVDGTGETPSVKMGIREAAYQGVVSFLAPIGVVKGTNKLIKKIASNSIKPPASVKKTADSIIKALNNNKITGKIMKTAGLPVKILGAFVSIAAISKLSKPIDFIADKAFTHVVDPLIGINRKDKAD